MTDTEVIADLARQLTFMQRQLQALAEDNSRLRENQKPEPKKRGTT